MSLIELLRSYERRVRAVENHASAEGHPTDTIKILESYDKALHPWMHGRRPADLLTRLKRWLRR